MSLFGRGPGRSVAARSAGRHCPATRARPNRWCSSFSRAGPRSTKPGIPSRRRRPRFAASTARRPPALSGFHICEYLPQAGRANRRLFDRPHDAPSRGAAVSQRTQRGHVHGADRPLRAAAGRDDLDDRPAQAAPLRVALDRLGDCLCDCRRGQRSACRRWSRLPRPTSKCPAAAPACWATNSPAGASIWRRPAARRTAAARVRIASPTISRNDPGRAPGKQPGAWWDNSSCRNPDFHLPDLGLSTGLSVGEPAKPRELAGGSRHGAASSSTASPSVRNDGRLSPAGLGLDSRPNRQEQSLRPDGRSRRPCAICTAARNGAKAFLVARRLVEAGVRMVQVNLRGWDTHQNAFRDLKGHLLPSIDRCLSGFLDDLAIARAARRDAGRDVRRNGSHAAHFADQRHRQEHLRRTLYAGPPSLGRRVSLLLRRRRHSRRAASSARPTATPACPPAKRTRPPTWPPRFFICWGSIPTWSSPISKGGRIAFTRGVRFSSCCEHGEGGCLARTPAVIRLTARRRLGYSGWLNNCLQSVCPMFHPRLRRLTTLGLLAAYLTASTVGGLIHDHDEAIPCHGAGHLSGGVAGLSLDAADGHAAHDDDCTICRFLGQRSLCRRLCLRSSRCAS